MEQLKYKSFLVKFIPVLLLCLLIISSLAGFSFAATSSDYKITYFVNDYAGIIDDSTELELEGILKDIYDSGVAEYAIVTVPSLEGRSIEEYSLSLAQGNLGDSVKNNGLLLFIAVEDRKYRFEVGRGLEGDLNDAKVGRIARAFIVPSFKVENYNQGILDASYAVAAELSDNVSSPYYVKEESFFEKNEVLISILILMILINILGSIGKAKQKGKYFSAASNAAILYTSFGKGGFGGSGGFGGGGFGGGGFGGGGSSGGW